MINAADSIKLSVSAPASVRFVVVDLPKDEDVDPTPQQAREASQIVRRAVNAWLYSQDA
jgi:hypothetical protein